MRTDCNWANTDCRDSSRIHVHAIIRLHNSRSTPASRRGKSLWWAFGGGDGLSLSVGVGAVDPDLLGPGRRHDHAGRGAVDRDADGGPNVPRNAPTTFNVAFYDVVLFHDGRIESIGRLPGRNGAGSGIITPDSLFRSADPDAGANLVEAQARFPLISEDEMLGFGFGQRRRGDAVRTHLSGRLGDYGAGRGELENTDWPAQFRRVFGQADAIDLQSTTCNLPDDELLTVYVM